MREHVGLFRGKRLEDGKWIEGSLVRAEDAVFISAKPKCYATCFTSVKDVGSFTEYSISWFFRVAPDTVCECTGVEDRNGMLIFEGDICTGHNPLHTHRTRYHVGFEDGLFGLYDECGTLWHMFNIENVEVIGNIHDNPELLE